MADEEDNGTPNVEVNVHVEEPPEPPPEETPEAPAVVVVATGEGNDDSGEVDRWVELERRLSGIETRIEEVQQSAWRAEDSAAEAVAEAVVSDVAVSEEVAQLAEEIEEVEETVDDSIAPSSTAVHPLFRPFRDWFPKRES